MAITLNNNTISVTVTPDATLGATSSNPGISASHIKAANPSATTGLYWIKPLGSAEPAQQIYCDMSTDGGGWMLVAANDARDSTIPGANSKNSTAYELNRTGALVGTQGISPNGDYIIGSIINTLQFNQVRVIGWGYGSTNGSTSWPNTLGTYYQAIWTLNTKGQDRLVEVVPVGNVSLSGTGSLSSSASFWVLDGIKKDRLNGGYTSNTGQSTVGAVGVAAASGDPTDGCYMGHSGSGGQAGGSYQGWYNAANTVSDCQGYATWVRDNTDYNNSLVMPVGYQMTGTVSAPGRVIGVTRFQNSTRTAVSASSSTTIWSAGNVNKKVSNSKLILIGHLVWDDIINNEVGAWWQIGSSGLRRDGLWHGGYATGNTADSIKVGWHIRCSYVTSAVGNLAVSIGWTTVDGASKRPAQVWNPNISDDGRSQQHTSELMIIEVGT